MKENDAAEELKVNLKLYIDGSYCGVLEKGSAQVGVAGPKKMRVTSMTVLLVGLKGGGGGWFWAAMMGDVMSPC